MAFTFFFRDQYMLDLMQTHVIPELIQQQYIHVWDAGCAMGPEPYTLAMVFRENMGAFLFRNLKIHATDIDASHLFGPIIREGVYPNEQLTNVPPAIFGKYFSAHARLNHSVINSQIQEAVVFQRHDLLTLRPIREALDLVVCKNVLLHFSEPERIQVLKMFHSALRPGGFLMTEQTQKMPQTLESWYGAVVPNGQLFRKRLRPLVGAKERGAPAPAEGISAPFG